MKSNRREVWGRAPRRSRVRQVLKRKEGVLRAYAATCAFAQRKGGERRSREGDATRFLHGGPARARPMAARLSARASPQRVAVAAAPQEKFRRWCAAASQVRRFHVNNVGRAD